MNAPDEREAERAAIVKWLRTQMLWTSKNGFLGPRELADAISRGQHRKDTHNG